MSFKKFSALRLQEPEIQFYVGKHISPRRIVTYKPFSYRDLLNEEIHVKLLADAETCDLGIQLVNHLINGCSVANESIRPFSEIFGAKIVFHKDNDVAKISSENLLVKLEETLDILRSEASRGIAIIALKDIPGDIYANIKVKTLSEHPKSTRAQFIKKETIENNINSGGYVYLLLNIATAIYAKVGGIPWKLSRSIFPVKGLILGISFSKKRIKMSDKEVIYYGAVQILDEHGEHLYTEIKMFTASPKELETKGLFVPYDKLKDILINTVKQHGKIPQIMIHKSAPIVDDEIKAVREVVKEYSSDEYPIFYIFAHIKTNTIYRAYDPSASDYSIRRGLMLLRSSKSSNWIQHILFTTGRLYKLASERDKLGTPKPLEIAVDTNMSDMSKLPNYIGKPVLALTKLDWNTTDPEVRKPITITYSRKAAQIAPRILSSQLPDLKVADIRSLM